VTPILRIMYRNLLSVTKIFFSGLHIDSKLFLVVGDKSMCIICFIQMCEDEHEQKQYISIWLVTNKH
jgi:hypothetical protein